VRYALPQLIPGLSNVATSHVAGNDRDRAYVDHLRALYDAISRQIGPEAILVDGSKSVPYLMSLREIQGLRIAVVHIVRDSRSVAMSWKRRRIRPEITDAKTEMPTMPTRVAAINWDLANGMADSLGRLPDLRYLRVRYEDFVAQPIEELTRLVAPLDVTPQDVAARFVGPNTIVASVDHTVSGNPSRFERSDITIRPDTDWRSALSASETRVVTAFTAPLLRRYGYPL
jgi:hypothetical protein